MKDLNLKEELSEIRNYVAEEEKDRQRRSIEDIYQEPRKQEDKASVWVKLILLFLLLAVAGGLVYGAYRYQELKKARKSQEKVSLSTVVGNIPASEKPTEDKSVKKEETPVAPQQEKTPGELTVNVLNGGSPAGSAGKIKTLLESAGYKKVTAGNAEGSAYIGVKIYAAENHSAEAEKVLAALKKSQPKAEIRTANSVEEKGADVVIILGQ